MPALAQQRFGTIDDIYALQDGERAELIDGQIYYMAPPTRKHQDIVGELFGRYPGFCINLSILNI